MTNSKTEYKVYILTDPISGLIKYVGVTKMSLRLRLNSHKVNAKDDLRYSPHKCNWINELKIKGLSPIIEVLEVYESRKEAEFWESYWTFQFKEWGFSLLNIYDGKNVPQSTRIKMSNAKKGVKQSPSHIKKSADSRRGLKLNETQRLKKIEIHRKYRIPVVCTDNNGNTTVFSSSGEAAKKLNILRTSIVNCLSGTSFSAWGYKWTYFK